MSPSLAAPLFTRVNPNPILTPSSQWWEARGVLNPGVAVYRDEVVLAYRAVGRDGISRFGLATSRDGIAFERRSSPFYEAPTTDVWARLGVEDPRVTQIAQNFYLTYTKASLDTAEHPPLEWEFCPFRVRSAIGMTQDFRAMQETASILATTNTKDAVLFPERIRGRYVALVREYPSIQLVTSRDLRGWSAPLPVLDPIAGTWEAERVGAGPPPLRTPWGWLLFYHANEYYRVPSNERLYRMGLALLDLDDPTRVLYRHPEPVFEPTATYECCGPVGNVVFGTGILVRGDTLLLYYGAADGVVGLAVARMQQINELIRAKSNLSFMNYLP